jgi:uncharacterized protein YraI
MKQETPALRLCLVLVFTLVVGSCSRMSAIARNPAMTGTGMAHLNATQNAMLSASSTPTRKPGELPSISSVPTVESLRASVTADLLSCRYGPGPNYLFLYGLRKGANIILIGRTEQTNWRWVYVAGKNKCWVKTDFLDIQGNWTSLPVVYPGMAKLPISPYYPATYVLHANRKQDQVTVEWADIPLRAGDEEDERMQHYVVEVWRCEDGRMLFEPIATNELSVTFTDEPGCDTPSHGRIFVQEKHGFAGPADIPWPAP